MTPIIRHTRGYMVHQASGDALVVIRRGLSQHPTTATERFLLMAIVAVLPLEGNLPKIGQFTFVFIMFGILAGYGVLCRPRILGKTLRHPVFLAGDALVGIGFLMEAVHGSTGYYLVFQIFLMLLGAVFIASLCRDRRALRSALYGLILAGVWLSVIFFLTTYTTLSSANVSNFVEASRLRIQASRSASVHINDNAIAFFTAQGVGVALALALTTSARLQHCVFLAMGAVCMIGTFLTMSRGGLAIMALSSAAILYAYGIRRARVIRVAAILAVVILLWVPEAVFHRFTVTPEKNYHGRDASGRTETYTAVIEHLPEYFLTGVGVSHFRGDWGRHTGFASEGKVHGAHNCYAQVTIYWGLPGLLALLALAWQAYRCLPERYSAEPLSLCLLSIAVSVLVYSFFMHRFEHKSFSTALGLLAGTNLWIWPRSSRSQQYENARAVDPSRLSLLL